jgi:hypothetical protein
MHLVEALDNALEASKHGDLHLHRNHKYGLRFSCQS